MVLVMYYKRNNKRLSVSGRGDYMSTSDFIIQYYTNGLLATIAKNVVVLTTIS